MLGVPCAVFVEGRIGFLRAVASLCSKIGTAKIHEKEYFDRGLVSVAYRTACSSKAFMFKHLIVPLCFTQSTCESSIHSTYTPYSNNYLLNLLRCLYNTLRLKGDIEIDQDTS